MYHPLTEKKVPKLQARARKSVVQPALRPMPIKRAAAGVRHTHINSHSHDSACAGALSLSLADRARTKGERASESERSPFGSLRLLAFGARDIFGRASEPRSIKLREAVLLLSQLHCP